MIAVITYLWDRPQIEEIVIDYYAHLRDSIDRKLMLVAAYSEETQISTLKRAKAKGWHRVPCPSKPMGRKLNVAMQSLREVDASHVITFGSDDLIHRRAFEQLCKAGERHPVAGFAGAYMLDTATRRGAHFQYPPSKRQRPCGAGRILSRVVLEKLKWTLRPDGASIHLDKALDDKLRSINVWWHMVGKDPKSPVVDVKTGRNLGSDFDSLLRHGATLLDWDDVVRPFGEPWISRLEGLTK